MYCSYSISWPTRRRLLVGRPRSSQRTQIALPSRSRNSRRATNQPTLLDEQSIVIRTTTIASVTTRDTHYVHIYVCIYSTLQQLSLTQHETSPRADVTQAPSWRGIPGGRRWARSVDSGCRVDSRRLQEAPKKTDCRRLWPVGMDGLEGGRAALQVPSGDAS